MGFRFVRCGICRGRGYPPHRFWEHEDTIFKEVISVFPEEMRRQALTVEKLFVMRHYGFPTRILDISVNPLVDLFFACFADKGDEASLEKDGIVYTYAVPTADIKFSDSDTVTILANLCKTHGDFSADDNEGAVDHFAYDIQEDKPHFHTEIFLDNPAGILNQVVCLRPRMNNPRIIRQNGYFFLFGINGKKENCAKMPEKWIQGFTEIPWASKKPILKELEHMGYNEGFFYPDFEHVNNVVRKRYGKER